MSVLDIIHKRRSYRGEYEAAAVPREDLRAIMEAGLAAPSGCNMQTTSLIAVDDPAVLEQLRAVIDPPVAETAPAVICVLTRRVAAYRDKCFAVQDYSAAIENMLLAITALGYQSCWYEGHITDDDRICDKMADILAVPKEYELVCMLPVGIGKSEAKAPPKKLFHERAWFNGYPTAKNREARAVTEAVARITRMEQIFDELRAAASKDAEAIHADPNLSDKLKTLTEYYEGGQWLSDYELDEMGVLPSGVKRGILSQDGIFDLLEHIAAHNQ